MFPQKCVRWPGMRKKQCKNANNNILGVYMWQNFCTSNMSTSIFVLNKLNSWNKHIMSAKWNMGGLQVIGTYIRRSSWLPILYSMVTFAYFCCGSQGGAFVLGALKTILICTSLSGVCTRSVSSCRSPESSTFHDTYRAMLTHEQTDHCQHWCHMSILGISSVHVEKYLLYMHTRTHTQHTTLEHIHKHTYKNTPIYTGQWWHMYDIYRVQTHADVYIHTLAYTHHTLHDTAHT